MAARRHYDFCGLTIASDLALPELRRARGAADCTIAVSNANPPPEDVEWFHAWRPRGGPVWLRFGRVRGGYRLRIRTFAQFFVDASASQVIAYPARDLPAATLQHLLVDQILPLVSAGRGRPTLHASAVHLDRFGAIAFVGLTGRGKSTLAAALAARGGRVLTDDCAAIDMTGPVPAIWPGYGGLRLWPGTATVALLGRTPNQRVAHYSMKRRIRASGSTGGTTALAFRSTPSRLRTLFVLAPRRTSGPAAAFRAVPPGRRILALMQSAYVLDLEDRGTMAGLLADMAALAGRVHVIQLRVRGGTRYLGEAAAMIERFARAGAAVLPS